MTMMMMMIVIMIMIMIIIVIIVKRMVTIVDEQNKTKKIFFRKI